MRFLFYVFSERVFILKKKKKESTSLEESRHPGVPAPAPPSSPAHRPHSPRPLLPSSLAPPTSILTGHAHRPPAMPRRATPTTRGQQGARGLRSEPGRPAVCTGRASRYMGCCESTNVAAAAVPEPEAAGEGDPGLGSPGTTEGKAGARQWGLGAPRAPAMVVPEPWASLHVAVVAGSEEGPRLPWGCPADGGETGPASVYPQERRPALAEGLARQL